MSPERSVPREAPAQARDHAGVRLDDELALRGKPEEAPFDPAASRALGVKNGNVLAFLEEIVFGEGAPALEKL